MRWGLRSLLVLLWLIWPARGHALPAETWVVVIGNNRGDASDLQLLYAERDAREMAEVLRSQGGVASDRLRLLIDENSDTVRRSLLSINALLRSNEGRPATALLVYYSGHADADALHLRGTHLPFDELRAMVQSSPATMRLLFVDACRSGHATRVKGVRGAPEFQIQLDNRVEAEGTAILSSSTADETSQESDRLRGSFFSHHLINALRGAADRNGDGRVTLSEAYTYTYAQTLRSTGQTLSLQHPTYAYDVKGSGDLQLTSVWDRDRSMGLLRLADASTYLITEEKETGAVVAEVTTSRDRAMLSLPQGRYFVQQRGGLEYREYQVTLRGGQESDLQGLPYRSLRYDQLVRKRGGTRRSVHGLTWMVGARGEVLAGEGASPHVVLGYGADLPWGSVALRLRGSTTSFQDFAGGLHTRRYEAGAALLLQRYVDFSWLSLSFGVVLEGLYEGQRFDSDARLTASRNTLALSFGALFAIERRLWRGLSLRVEGGPLALLDRRGVISDGTERANALQSVFTWWLAGGAVWRM